MNKTDLQQIYEDNLMLKLTVKQIKDRIFLVENQLEPEYGSPKERMEWYEQDQAYLRRLYKLLKERKANG